MKKAVYRPNVLVTGADGYLGRLFVAALSSRRREFGTIVATDVRAVEEGRRLDGVEYARVDVRNPAIGELMTAYRIQAVVHLASIVTPTKRRSRAFEYSVDVVGTRQVLDQCVKHGVGQLVVTSSGAAYGYYADNPAWLDENDPIRGNLEFAYSYHKRLIEQELARFRHQHPQLRQLVLRSGTIIGAATKNAITDLFDKPVILGVAGHDAPFVFIWDQDVVSILLKGVLERKTGTFNLAGDGAVTTREIARLIDKPYLEIGAGGLAAAIGLLKRLGLTQYGPEQVNFLRYRPVLSNDRLRTEFGYTPMMTSREAFEFFWRQRTRSNEAS